MQRGPGWKWGEQVPFEEASRAREAVWCAGHWWRREPWGEWLTLSCMPRMATLVTGPLLPWTAARRAGSVSSRRRVVPLCASACRVVPLRASVCRVAPLCAACVPCAEGWAQPVCAVSCRWDAGQTNNYRVGAEGAFDLLPVPADKARPIVLEENATMGLRVVRGPDWKVGECVWESVCGGVGQCVCDGVCHGVYHCACSCVLARFLEPH